MATKAAGKCAACWWQDYKRGRPDAYLVEMEPTDNSRRWEVWRGRLSTGTILQGDPRNCTCLSRVAETALPDSESEADR